MDISASWRLISDIVQPPHVIFFWIAQTQECPLTPDLSCSLKFHIHFTNDETKRWSCSPGNDFIVVIYVNKSQTTFGFSLLNDLVILCCLLRISADHCALSKPNWIKPWEGNFAYWDKRSFWGLWSWNWCSTLLWRPTWCWSVAAANHSTSEAIIHLSVAGRGGALPGGSSWLLFLLLIAPFAGVRLITVYVLSSRLVPDELFRGDHVQRGIIKTARTPTPLQFLSNW